MRFAPYNDYKPSGVEWLGDVPAHWEVRRLKRICRLAYGDSLSSENRVDGNVPVYGSNGQVGFHSFPNTNGQCLIIGRKGSFGKVQYSFEPVFAIDTTFFVDSRYTDANIRWLYYLLGWLQLDTVSKDSAVPGLNREDAYQYIGFYPPLSEQTAIVRYLDQADERIRRYISSRERLIERLEEYRQSFIQHAVTRGLDPDVRLKPSGVEWLGDVPAHWEVRRFKTIGKNFTNGTTAEQLPTGISDFPVSRIETISTGQIDYSKVGYLNESSVIKSFYLQPDDFLISHINSYERVGNSARYKGDLTLLHGMNLIRVTPLKVIVPNYLEYLLKSSQFIGSMQRACKPAINQVSVTTAAIKAIQFPLPPLAEQTAIVAYLNKATADIDTAIDRARREIELLGEYHTRLIADVVTGKVDVREAVAGLPQ